MLQAATKCMRGKIKPWTLISSSFLGRYWSSASLYLVLLFYVNTYVLLLHMVCTEVVFWSSSSIITSDNNKKKIKEGEKSDAWYRQHWLNIPLGEGWLGVLSPVVLWEAPGMWTHRVTSEWFFIHFNGQLGILSAKVWHIYGLNYRCDKAALREIQWCG